jgi:hypothetical protein
MLFVIGANMNRAKANSPKTPFLILVMGLMLMVILPSVLNRANASKTEAQEQTSVIGPGKGAVQTAETGCTDVSFAQPAGSPVGVGTLPRSIATADFNADGKLDMAVANGNSNNVTVLLGNGIGGFTQAAGSPVSAGSELSSIAVGDFNLDGKLDMAVSGQGLNKVTILLGNGSGGFAQAAGSPINVGNNPSFVATGDFSGDGKLDLAVANLNDSSVSIMLGNGSGGFTQAAGSPLSVGSSPRSIGISDFNADGRLDLAVANATSGTLSVLLGTGGGGFTQAGGSPINVGTFPQSIAISDFNRDGKPDLAVASTVSNNIRILLGSGGGLFSAASPVSIGTSPICVTAGDFNLDGKPDLASANGGSSNTAGIRLGDGTGAFTQPASPTVGAGAVPNFIATADFNNDGKPDLAISSQNNNNITVYLNTCTAYPCVAMSFAQATGSPVSLGTSPIGNVVKDFNLDGKLDLAISQSGGVAILLGNGSGGFTQAAGSPLSTGASPLFFDSGDFNLDGKPDLALQNFNGNNVTILLGDGNGGFTQAAGSPITVGTGPEAVTVGDFNLDGKPDLATANATSNDVTILLGNGSGGFTQAAGSPIAANTAPFYISAGDFNADGKLDLTTPNSDPNGGKITILLGNGSGGFTQAAGSPINIGLTPTCSVISDFNTDGKLDLAIANSFSGTISILLGNGAGGFANATGSPITIGVGTSPRFLALSDYNRDGKMDLAVNKRNSNQVVILLGNGSGGFTLLASPIATGVQPATVGAGDFDRDGKPDLVAVNNTDKNANIFLNTCVTGDPPTITAMPVSSTAGSPSMISQIATVSDIQDAANTLAVTVNSGASATVNGVTVSGISVNAAGTVTADVIAACGATTADFTLRVIDSSTLFTEATLTVTVTPNPAPTLGNYPTATIPQGGGTTVTPDAAPSDNGTITSVTASAPSFAGTFSVNQTSGVVTISNAAPQGSYTVTVTATDNCNVMTTATFTLNVEAPTPLGNYPNTTVDIGANTTVTPDAAPTNIVRVNVSTSTGFYGTLVANPSTGVVRVTDAQPAGTYPITVKTFDNMGGTFTRTFNLIVQNPAVSCATPSFSPAANVAAGDDACSVAVGDFNGDGNQDLAIANNTAIPATVSIRLGNGAGGFTGTTNVQVGVPAGQPPAQTGVQPNHVVVGDFNGDGNQDFATANLGVGTVSIRLGDGAGNFTGVTATSEVNIGGVDSTTVALAIGDFNGDGKQDLAVANTSAGNVRILIGDGLGAFTVPGTVTFGSAQSVAVGDFNSDGKQDLIISGGTSVGIRLGDGLGGFSGSTNILIGANTQPRSLVIGDFNGDGKQDFAVTAAGVLGTDNRVFVRLGDGLGNFSGTTVLTVGTNPRSIAIGDYNKDGKQDLAIAITNSNTVSIRLGDGAGGFSGSMDVPTGSRPLSVAAGDFNEDGTLDFAAINGSNNNASIRLGGCTPNTAPTISAQAGLSRQQGSPASNSTIAMVGDAESGPGGVTVTVTTTNPSNGVRIQNIVNTNGTITANFSATCTATNATFNLQASDGNLATSVTLSVAVTANSAPVLTYGNATALVGTSTMVNPATGPSDNGTFSVAFVSVSPNTFTGTISANTSTGIVTITNAAPEGAYTVNIRITDNCNVITNTSFTLNVTNTLTWNGSTSNNWNTAANWIPSVVPTAPNDVVIPASSVTNEPVLSTATATVNNLTVAAGRTLTLNGQNMTVNGTLSLSGGLIDTGANTLTLGTTATISRASGQVMGNLKKQFGGAGSFTYTVGTANGYSPIDATVTAGSGELTVKAVQGPQPIVDASQSLQRYWSLNGSGITVNLVFHYLDPTDIPAGGSDASYRIIRVSEGTATSFLNDCASGSPCVDPAADTMTINNVSSFSDWTAGAAAGPTAVRLEAMQASRYDNGALIKWQTGYEVDNLGFNVYREISGRRELVNAELLAGSALVTGRAAMLAGRRYALWDGSGNQNSEISYYIEDLDLNGKTTMHGPVKPQRVGGKPPAMTQADVLSRLGESAPRVGQAHPGEPENRAITAGSSAAQAAQGELAGKAAVKMSIRETGWYRVKQPELMAAKLDPRTDPRRLQLYVDGVEQPMLVIGESDGRFDESDTMEFYGMALDTPATDEHVYWLVAGNQPGKRLSITPSKSKRGGATSFAYTSERRDRTIYFSGLLNGETENFFGAVVTTQAVDQTLMIQHLDPKAADTVTLEVALQGVTDLPVSSDHLVNVALNGVTVGALSFDGREHKVERMTVNAGLLQEGANTVTLTAAGGNSDVSLVDYIRLTYAHSYAADNDALICTATNTTAIKGSDGQTLSGFTSPLIRVIDITDPQMPIELAGQIEATGNGYAVSVGLKEGTRILMAFTDTGIKQPAAISANQGSSLRQPMNGADLLVITRREFFAALAPLIALRQSQGLSVQLVNIEDIYDEFSYGNKAPQAVKEFITYAKTMWKKKPQYVLLGGKASYDGRNYLGYGDVDAVPTTLIDTTFMETASDEALGDLDGDGVAELAVGRLPFRTAAEAALMVAKIIGYEAGSASEEMLLVADENEGYDFERASSELQNLIPASLHVSQINRGRLEAAEAKRLLIDGINRKQLIVNYAGHGSVDLWRGNLLTGVDAAGLQNGDHLSVFVLMTCLNSYFDDPGLDSLGEALLKAERGGAVAVWGSSAMVLPGEQAAVNQELYRLLFGTEGSGLRLGETMRRAKRATSNRDVRRTFLLLGDPTMRLK